MAPTTDELMKATLSRVFGERDDDARVAAANEIYAADIVFSDAEGTVTGVDALVQKAKGLLDGAPGFEFTPRGSVRQAQDLGMLAWAFGPAGAPPVVTGVDIATVRDGRIATLHTLLDVAEPAAG